MTFQTESSHIRPYILIVNDDGIAARGINFLVSALAPMADILVMAPDGARSGFGMSITSAHPLRVVHHDSQEGIERYSCSGTPVDCAKVALNKYCRRRPDILVSGINHGDNSSVNSHYSGTMGAAMEAALQGIPSIAFSLDDWSPKADFEPLRPYLQRMTQQTLDMKLPPFTCLNVNFPKRSHFEGVRVCRMSKSRWQKEVMTCSDGGRGGDWYWLTGKCVELEPEATDTDRWALFHGFVAVTPTTLDNTAYALMKDMQEHTNWEEDREV